MILKNAFAGTFSLLLAGGVWADAGLDTGVSETVLLGEHCSAVKGFTNDSYSIIWDVIRSDAEAERCITEVAKLSDGPDQMINWLVGMGFDDAEILRDKERVAIMTSWDSDEHGSSSPYGSRIGNFFKGLTSRGRGIVVHITFDNHTGIRTEISRTVL